MKLLNAHSRWKILMISACCITATIFGQESHLASSESYRLSLAIVSGMASCTDRWSRPEYYATAKRDDPPIDRELDVISGEMKVITSAIKELEDGITPLEEREHNTQLLSAAEDEELVASRQQLAELQSQLKEKPRTMTVADRQKTEALVKKELAEIYMLENRMPLTDYERSQLQQYRTELGPLEIKRRSISRRWQELRPLVYMRTPGSLRVYPDDILRIRLMEDDVNVDDICESWNLVLDSETLRRGGIDLEKSGKKILEVWFRRE